MTDSRRANRIRTLLGARVVKAGLLMVDVHVKDITERGARLIVEPGDMVPDEFDLDIPRKGRSHKASVRWREAGSIGVEFVDEIAPAENELDSRIKQLEAENQMLRRRIADLAKRLDGYGDSERLSI